MKPTLLSLLLLVIFSSGCTVYQISSKDSSQDFYAPKTNIDQVAYIEKVDKPYVQIAQVTVTTERNQAMESVIPKLKQEAAILGADAITDVRGEAAELWKQLKPQKFLGNAYIRTDYTAKAIVWK